MLNYIINLISTFLPATRFYVLKRFLYKFVGFKFKKNVSIGNHIKSYVRGTVKVGNNVWLGRELEFTVPQGTEVIIGSNVDIAPYVRFLCGSHSVGDSYRRAGVSNSKSISIGDGCWIGASSLILGGANISSGTVIAAGSVVIAGDYPKNIMLAGVPAKMIRRLSDC